MSLNNKNCGIIGIFIIMVIGMGCILYKMYEYKEKLQSWDELAARIEMDGDDDAYLEMMRIYPQQMETLPYSIIMASKHKCPQAFLYVYTGYSQLGVLDSATTDAFTKEIAMKYLEEGTLYDTVDQICLLELIKIMASDDSPDSAQLMSYIKQLRGVNSDSACVFLYYKVLDLYRHRRL